MAELKKQDSSDETKKVIHTYPLLRHTDMAEHMMTDTIDLITAACDKHSANNENAARAIKESLDKKYGSTWHCVVGETFGLDVSFEMKHILYMFIGGNLAVAVWKCC